MAWEKYFWYYTPQKEYADFSALNQLEKVQPEVTIVSTQEGDEGIITLMFRNLTKSISFFNEVILEKKASGDPVLPQFLNDNYISIMPGESKSVIIRYKTKNLNGEVPVVKIQGMNLKNKIEL
jgi:exo-1,4-beta-D-glucosaminidase